MLAHGRRQVPENILDGGKRFPLFPEQGRRYMSHLVWKYVRFFAERGVGAFDVILESLLN